MRPIPYLLCIESFAKMENFLSRLAYILTPPVSGCSILVQSSLHDTQLGCAPGLFRFGTRWPEQRGSELARGGEFLAAIVLAQRRDRHPKTPTDFENFGTLKSRRRSEFRIGRAAQASLDYRQCRDQISPPLPSPRSFSGHSARRVDRSHDQNSPNSHAHSPPAPSAHKTSAPRQHGGASSLPILQHNLTTSLADIRSWIGTASHSPNR